MNKLNPDLFAISATFFCPVQLLKFACHSLVITFYSGKASLSATNRNQLAHEAMWFIKHDFNIPTAAKIIEKINRSEWRSYLGIIATRNWCFSTGTTTDFKLWKNHISSTWLMTSLIPVYTKLGTRNVPEILYVTKTSLFCQNAFIYAC